MTTLVILFLAFPSVATQKRDSIVVSLLTAWPGPEVYQLCGHSAIRIRGAEVDSVWNYGVFNFDEPNFVYRFVKGETDYMLVGYPTMWFMPEYLSEGRKVLEQDLNLTQDEAWELRSLLQTEALPQNRTYRYNYVKDNCATRITDRLAQAADARLIFPDTIAYGTFRREMRAFHRDYPWYQFGIDLALGSGIDKTIDNREKSFAPVVLDTQLAGATVGGRRLVRQTRVINDVPADNAVLAPTPWYLTPLAVCWAFFVLVAAVCVYDVKKKRCSRWIYGLVSLIYGLAGLLIWFLVFVSEHEATAPNLVMVWLNPLWLVTAVSVWIPRARLISFYAFAIQTVAVTLLMLFWLFAMQISNAAFWPLMFAGVAASESYVWKNKELLIRLPVKKTGRSEQTK